MPRSPVPPSVARAVLLLAFAHASAVAAGATYHATDLTPPGDADSACVAVDDQGATLGTGDGDHLFLRDAGGRLRVVAGTVGRDGDTVEPAALGDGGVVAGAIEVDPVFHFRQPFAWRPGGKLLRLPTLGGFTGSAAAVNGVGAIVGTSATGGGDAARDHATLWSGGQVVDLAPGSADSSALDINAQGVATGQSDGRPVVFTGGAVVPLAGNGVARAINGGGHVAGQVSSGSVHTATLWREGEQVALGDLGGGNSLALDVNDDDVVVGFTSRTGTTRFYGFVWQAGTMQALDDLVPAAERGGWSIERAAGINAAGQVCATAVSPNGRHRKGLLLTPAP